MATRHLTGEQHSLSRFLSYLTIDSNIKNRLNWFMEGEVDSIYKSLLKDTLLPDSEKVLAIQSMARIMDEIGENFYLDKFNMYDIPRLLETFKLVFKAIVYQMPFEELLKPLDVESSKILARTFWNYNEHELLDDIAVYKDVSSSPSNILQFLERNPGFRFTDSLLFVLAAYAPMELSNYLLVDSPGVREQIRQNKNIFLQQVVSISGNLNASELMPMIVPLAEKKITESEIIKKRMEVKTYFQLLVNTLIEELTRPEDSSFIFRHSLRNAIKEKSVYFYVQRINEQHGAPESVRFASVKGLRPEDLYYVITSCEDELYTSSYLGLYHRLMEYFRSQPADSLFRLMHYDNFRIFMRLAANYNTLADFLSCMPEPKSNELLHRLISGIEIDTESGLEKAMDIADSYMGLAHHLKMIEFIKNEMYTNLDRCQKEQLYYGVRLYDILLQVFELVIQKDSANELWTYLGDHEKLKRKALQNKKGEIIELVLFYGDEDGVTSYDNFTSLFRNKKIWLISKNEFWVTIRSLSSQHIVIYANLPLDGKAGLDFQAQDTLSKFLKTNSISPVILVHRGHSYHISKSLIRMEPSVKLAILGSCGGYNSILSVTNIDPEAQVIVSKKTGSKFINDPLINVINETLMNKKDLIWTEIWEKLEIRFAKNQVALSIFNEYIPPRKNLSLFVARLFNDSR